jgi:Sulfotransferase domain
VTLANTVIAGSGRSGTTAIFRYLSEHPDVCVSTRKETNYFEYAFYREPQAPLAEYARHFSRCNGEKIVLEASPGYLSDGIDVAVEVNRVLGSECRVFIVLREPVERLVSFYNQAVSMGRISASESFEEYVDRCRSLPSVRVTRESSSQVLEGYHGGFYLEPIREWTSVFGDRLKIAFYDDLQVDAVRFMSEMAEWLGINAEFYRERELSIENASHTAKFQGLHSLARWLNETIEPLGQRYPNVMRKVRRTYLRLNTSEPVTGISADLAKALSQEYRASNLSVGEFLAEHGLRTLPDWLLH